MSNYITFICVVLHCNAVQCCIFQCSTVQFSTVSDSAVQCQTVQYSVRQCSTVSDSAVQCTVMHCHYLGKAKYCRSNDVRRREENGSYSQIWKYVSTPGEKLGESVQTISPIPVYHIHTDAPTLQLLN